MTYEMNKQFIADILENYTLEEAIARIAYAISNRDEIINDLKNPKPVEDWEDRMGGQFTNQEIEDAKGGW